MMSIVIVLTTKLVTDNYVFILTTTTFIAFLLTSIIIIDIYIINIPHIEMRVRYFTNARNNVFPKPDPCVIPILEISRGLDPILCLL